MINKYKLIAFGLGCFGVGVVTGYIYANRTLREMYLEDIQETKNFYNKKLEELGVMPAESEYKKIKETDFDEGNGDFEGFVIATGDDVTDEEARSYYERVMGRDSHTGEPFEVDLTEEEFDRMVNVGSRRIRTNYNKPDLRVLADEKLRNDPYHGDDMEEEDDFMTEEEELDYLSDEFIREQAEHRANKRPYVIDHDEFATAPDDYESIILYYYAEDRALVDENDDRVSIDDEEELLGFDYEDVIDIQTTAWVRNDYISAVYEINRVEGSYERDVLNAIETPSERAKRLERRKNRK